MEEEDYMNDTFLNVCASDDFRPGLVHSRSQKRTYDIEQRKEVSNMINKKRFKSTVVLQNESRVKGLEQPLGPDNKGFAMLKKMGFKPGSSLGATNSGIVEPIGIIVKNDRAGLGKEQALKEIELKKKEYLLRRRTKVINVEDYRSALSRKHKEKEIILDFLKSQKACYALDVENKMNVPEEKWFWPENLLENSEEGDDDTEENDYEWSEKLEMLTLYLRKAYRYCIWCGLKFTDDDDISLNCPGSTRDDH